jgi:acylphosphatase
MSEDRDSTKPTAGHQARTARCRREVVYRGRVQGVGFRYTARNLASHFRVTGYVKNLPDGGVRLVAEGKAGELDRFLDAVADSMSRYIESMQVTDSPATGEFTEFNVRY